MFFNRKKLKAIPWPQLMVESLLVILSVVLALALNNWNQNRIEENIAEQALQNIINEIEANQEEVKKAYNYNRSLIKEMETDPNRGVSLHPANIRDFAWETAQVSGAVSSLEFPVISIVAEIHELQEEYKNQIMISTELIYQANMRGVDYFAGREANFFLNTMYDIRSRERRLLDRYKEALKIIK